MKWFKKHLNITLVLTILATVMLTGAIDTLHFLLRLLVIPVIILGIVVATWYLRQKNRSLGWYFGALLVCMAGAGMSRGDNGLVDISLVIITLPSIFILFLSNKNANSKETKKD